MPNIILQYTKKDIAMVAGVQGTKNKESMAVTCATICPVNSVIGAQDLFCLNTAFLIDLFL